MNISSLTVQRGIHVSVHCPAVLQHYTLAFNLSGVQYVEPAFAGLREEEDGEVHGTAFCMDRENEARLDRVEGLGIAYRKERVNLRGYDGAQMEGFVYLPLVDMEGLPSARYLGILCRGAREAGLSQHYIAMLESREVYRPEREEQVIRIRKEREEQLKRLPEMTLVQLETKGREEGWTSILGMVVTLPSRPDPKLCIVWQYAVSTNMETQDMTPGQGREVTYNLVTHYRGTTKLELGHQDQKLPVVAELTKQEVDYVEGWLDHFMLCGGSTLVGRLKEFIVKQGGQ